MLFHSSHFFLFFACVLLVHQLRLPWAFKKWNLLAASWFFYAAWNPPFVLLLVLTTVVSWYTAERIHDSEDGVKRKRWLWLNLAVNLGILGFFKYGGFFLWNYRIVAGGFNFGVTVPNWSWLLPAGISFYTFQALSYVLDVYFRKTPATRNFRDVALYIAFFPQLVAGPIVRSTDFLPQLKTEPRRIADRVQWGLFLFGIGLFQKMFVADFLCAPVADQIFDHANTAGFLTCWTGTLAFTVQIFCDFSGYSNCAIGAALCLGFQLPENFRAPYAALGFSDFWKRWHITLSTWFRDYVYVPLGGSRRHAPLRTIVNLMVTMVLAGLWHGASWRFILWGGLHGILLVLEALWRRFLKSRDIRLPAWTEVPAIAATFLVICITMMIFRAHGLSAIFRMMAGMTGFSGIGSLGGNGIIWGVSAALFAIHLHQRRVSYEAWVRGTSPWITGAVFGMALFLCYLSSGNPDAFIYFQF